MWKTQIVALTPNDL